jgi:hypothetical protein
MLTSSTTPNSFAICRERINQPAEMVLELLDASNVSFKMSIWTKIAECSILTQTRCSQPRCALKNDNIEISNIWSIFPNSASLSPKFWAKIMWVLAILRVKNINITIRDTLLLYSKSALFSEELWAKILRSLAIMPVKKIKSTRMRHCFLWNFELK